jgi:tetratricopeptide (TPR) repeat protein
MKKTIVFLLLGLLVVSVFPAQKGDEFSRAIAYYLIGDLGLTRKNLDNYFSRYPQPAVKLGFILLLQNEKWEASKKFNDYLQSDHRSLEALIGISLATADLKNSLSINNLSKILRMNPGFAPAYLCLGNEYFLRHDYPAAEEKFTMSLKYAQVPEFKILLAELYLQTAQPQKAFDLLRPQAEADPANYYYALLTARACLRLDNCQDMPTLVDHVLKIRPESREAQLLKGQYLLKTGDWRQAKSILGKLKFNYYNPEYSLTYAEVLQKLKDRDAEKYLYEVFSQNQWQPMVNKLLGLFHLQKKSANAQNWINRAILSGMDPQGLRKEFPAQFDFPSYNFLPVFDVKKIQWLANKRIAVAGILRSGDKEKLLVLDAGSLKTIKSFEYEGAIQDMFASPKLDKIIFSTTAEENEKVYVYTLLTTADTYKLKPVVGYALKIPRIIAGFNDSGTIAYVTDASMPEMAFSSPFSTVSSLGRKVPVYPNFPYPVFSYTYARDLWTEIKNRNGLRGVNLPAVQQYLLVADAYQDNSEIAKLMDKGMSISITASEEMKLRFNEANSHFLLSFSDLKNAFQGWVCGMDSGKTMKFDETMFLGEKSYTDLDLIAFHPEKNEILVCTKDKEKNLVLFNYKSLIYKKLSSGVLATGVAPDGRTIYALTERSKSFYFSEANLEIIHLDPFNREKITARRDLNGIMDCRNPGRVYFSTYNGELLSLDEEGDFSTRQVSLAGSLYQPSPDNSQVAAFINGRVYVLSWMK